VERLTREAAAYERTRLSRDLHDRTVQPYVGLKFAIEAVARKLPPDSPLRADIQMLLQMTSAELAGLKNVVGGLRKGPEGGALLASIRQQAQRFSELFGIHVHVRAEGDAPDIKRLRGEILAMVSEGLSNVWQHTRARGASIRLGTEGDWLRLEIRNEHGAAPPPRFVPASIAERAAALGGAATVLFTEDRHTVVDVRIPLSIHCEASHGTREIRRDPRVPGR
jgi:signal transduction histidine kinase